MTDGYVVNGVNSFNSGVNVQPLKCLYAGDE